MYRIKDFAAKVDRTGPCWLWIGAKDGNGRGHLRWRDQGHVLAHRVAWELAYGPIPEGMNVLHRCDVGNCCRPTHLFLGTQADNVADAIRKGRMRGEIGGSKCPRGHVHIRRKLAVLAFVREATVGGGATATEIRNGLGFNWAPTSFTGALIRDGLIVRIGAFYVAA